MGTDYTTVTEVPGVGASREQLEMLYARYRYAAQFCAGKDVLEVACGSGHGLGYLAKTARRVVGGDYMERLVRAAQQYYNGRVSLLCLDAHTLPFQAHSFDVVILYEAIYYLAQPDRFLDECRRVLRDAGILLICTVNKEWSDFNPSPFSTRYFSAGELSELLRQHQFQVELQAAFPVARESIKDVAVSLLKRTVVSLHLMPKTMKGKEFLKRIFFGKLVPLPAEVDEGMVEYRPSIPITNDSSLAHYKILYAIARASKTQTCSVGSAVK